MENAALEGSCGLELEKIAALLFPFMESVPSPFPQEQMTSVSSKDSRSLCCLSWDVAKAPGMGSIPQSETGELLLTEDDYTLDAVRMNQGPHRRDTEV